MTAAAVVLEGISIGGSLCGSFCGRVGDVDFLCTGVGDLDLDLLLEEVVTEEEVTGTCSSTTPVLPFVEGPCDDWSSELESESPGFSVLLDVESTSPFPCTFFRISGAPSLKACDVFSCAR